MTRTVLLALALALAIATAGCASPEFRSVAVEPLLNLQGHVIGHKETLRGNGDVATRISLYLPRLEQGRVVGYEERVRGGAVLLDLHGRRIGKRFVDLRSRGTNPGNRGLTIVVHSTPARTAVPSIEELKLLAQLAP